MNEVDVKTEIKTKPSIFEKTILQLTDEVAINPMDISSLEVTQDETDYWGSRISRGGTVLIMRSGAKIFVKGLNIRDIKVKVDAFMENRMSK